MEHTMEKPMNTKEAAAYMGLTESTLRHWRAKGKGPKSNKPLRGKGGRVWYYQADLDAWIRNGCEQ